MPAQQQALLVSGYSMKTILTLTFFLIFTSCSLSQLPPITYPIPQKDSFSFINRMPDKPIFVMIFSTESYWWSNTDNYRLISYNGSTWTIWNYFRRWKSSSQRYSKTWPKNKKYFIPLGEIDGRVVAELFDSLGRLNFWELNEDSLSETKGEIISDDVDYIFKFETQIGKKILSSYAPEYYLNIFPDMNQRKYFLAAYRYFESWWKKNSR